MAGKKGMKHYGTAIIEEVLKMKDEGKTNLQIGHHFKLDRLTIKRLLYRYNRKLRQPERENPPRKRGRPRKIYPHTPEGKDELIKQLTMENELLRSFLSDIGRR